MAAGVALALPDLDTDPAMAAALTGLLAWTTFRTFWLVPATFGGTWSLSHRTTGDSPVEVVLAELGVGLGVVALSGGWDSPFLLILVVGVLQAGLSRGYAGGLAAAGAIGLTLALLALPFDRMRADPATASQGILVYLCTAAVAGFARRLLVEAAAGEAESAQRLAQLGEVNSLLSQLARVAPGLPASLDLDEALTAGIDHLADLFDFTAAAVLVLDPATGRWRTAAARGLPTPSEWSEANLPGTLEQATRGGTVTFLAEPGTGIWAEAASGLYAPLVARERLVALIAMEHLDPDSYGLREAELLAGLAPPLALAIDNGMWFERLRRLGAEAERERLARSLHDRVGAGLAYVGIELDRLARMDDPAPELARLRKEVSGLLAEVRETLTDLRARVTDTDGLARLAGTHVQRFATRTGITARFHHDPGCGRLPLGVEQELWRILQEALADVERHSGATAVDVTWTVGGGRACLEIVDDAAPADPAPADQSPYPSLPTIGERANSIGARMRVGSSPGGGLRLSIEVATGPEAWT